MSKKNKSGKIVKTRDINIAMSGTTELNLTTRVVPSKN